MNDYDKYWHHFAASGNPLLYIAYRRLSKTDPTHTRDYALHGSADRDNTPNENL